jgi:hypothetical protein
MVDANPGDGAAARLKRYWTVGEGGKIKIRWGSSGDFTRCVMHLSKYLGPEDAKRYCAERHHEMNGFWPGDKRNN